MTTPTTTGADLLPTARRDALAAAARAGVRIEVLTDPRDLAEAEAVIRSVWDARPTDSSIVNAAMMRAISHAGGYVGGVRLLEDPSRLVGACVGFCSAPEERAIHSHVAGMLAGRTGRGAGTALKLHQRAWALERGFTSITWTYDPLIARNAHFNLNRLGATFEEYLVDFYGALEDRINDDEASDRVLVRWTLADPTVARRAGGHDRVEVGRGTRDALVLLGRGEGEVPLPGGGAGQGARGAAPATPGGGGAWVAVPTDTEALRRRDPGLAHRWRLAVREALTGALAGGLRVTGFDRTHGYLLEGESA